MSIPTSWKCFLNPVTTQVLEETEQKLNQMRSITPNIYPDQYDIFNALKLTQPTSVKVVILGQDPYHTKGAAHGLAFSIRNGYPVQPSLKNIFQKLQDDFPEMPYPTTSNLSRWAEQGVLLLNTSLSVEEGKPGSHRNVLPWQDCVLNILRELYQTQQPIAYLLWGKDAQTTAIKAGIQPDENHFIMMSSHPSPFSAHRATGTYPAFFNTHPFRDVNKWLLKKGLKKINWQLP